ncbi:4685_t:CDS:10, partial [Acaulospora colombiana]
METSIIQDALDDSLSILVATDNHLGFLEKDPIRGDDSLNTFKEILSLAKEHKVDLILLGGDLFHDNRPSRKTLYETMKLLRSYCIGNSRPTIELGNDLLGNGSDSLNNFQNPVCNISMPVFSIHGNHDDPSGDGNLCALDLLSVSGLINYFGKVKEVDNVIIDPILIKKGGIKLALYGFGNIRDERLHRMFIDNNVKVNHVDSSTDDWFNLMVLHQNRHVAKLEIRGPGDFHMEKIRLRTVRPFVIGEVVLQDFPDLMPDDSTHMSSLLVSKVEELIEEAKENWLETNEETDDSKFPLPLVKLRAREFKIFNNRQFGQNFVNQVANNQEILFFYKKNPVKSRTKKENTTEMDMPENLSKSVVNELISECLETLDILPELALSDSVTLYVDKEDQDAIADTIKNVRSQLKRELIIEDEKIIAEQTHKQKVLLAQQYAQKNPEQRFAERGKTSGDRQAPDYDEDFASDNDRIGVSSSSKSRNTRTTRGTNTRGRGRARTRGRGKSSTSRQTRRIMDDDGFDDSDTISTNATNNEQEVTATRSSTRIASLRPRQNERNKYKDSEDSDDDFRQVKAQRGATRNKKVIDEYVEEETISEDMERMEITGNSQSERKRKVSSVRLEEPPSKKTSRSGKIPSQTNANASNVSSHPARSESHSQIIL